MTINIVLSVILILLIAAVLYQSIIQKKPRATQYNIKIKFAHGIKTRLTLNESQYEAFKEWENQTDGYYIVGDEFGSHVKLHREYVCAIEVKKK